MFKIELDDVGVSLTKDERVDVLVNFIKKSYHFFKNRHEYKAIDFEFLNIYITNDPESKSIGWANYDSIHLNMHHYSDVPDMLKTLAHELAHVHQYQNGDLKMLTDGYIFKNKQYAYYKTDKEYYNAPEEIHARKHEHLGRDAFNWILKSA